jgi:putative transposase
MELNKLYFFTATIHKWIPVLRRDELKQMILNSLRFMVSEQAMKLSAFVIMPNHIHLLIMPLSNPKYKNVQLSLMRFTGQKIMYYLQDQKDPDLDKFLVNSKDRKYQFWQRNPMAIELYTRSVAEQKLDYIHSNPVRGKWDLSETDLDYPYSSIKFYEESEDYWPFITHYKDLI